ncbi:MAG TPA: hypothetical protein VNG51_27975 [Ktedonobacteraceae bacterium]|nr:hypothetical protein [Ktedonobacteraceae bacterium]
MAKYEKEWECPGHIKCSECGIRFRVQEKNIYHGCIDCNYCHAQIRLYEIFESSMEDERCENCDEPVGMNNLSLGYMKSEGGGYEMAMLCNRCRGYDPVM